MNSVERVKALCKEQKIPISKLERDLGYSNGYISQLRKGVFPSDRLAAIANYLQVSPEYLMNGETVTQPKPAKDNDNDNYYLNDETREIAQEAFENPELRTLFHVARDIPPERLKAHIDFMKALKAQERGDYDEGC